MGAGRLGEGRLTERGRLGEGTMAFGAGVPIIASAAVAGPLEGQGPLRESFDHVYSDLLMGQQTFELAEREMLKNACFTALTHAGLAPAELQFVLSGDLLNQLVTSSFTALDLKVPYLGLYTACATVAEGLGLGAALLSGGFAERLLVCAGSHNCSAERQYRYPVEYGSQRRPYAQWTVTAAGAAILASSGDGPRVTHATIGRVLDLGITDPYNQGAAMAPAAVDTLRRHLADTGRRPEDYDLIATGDLASFGKQMARTLAARDAGLTLDDRYQDCGDLIFDQARQDVHSGGAGAGCSASVCFGHLLQRLRRKELRRLLLIATGALFSPTSFQQGENIPAVAHAVAIEA